MSLVIFNIFGSLASIVSLLISVWVALEVSSLHTFYKRQIFFPQYIKDLKLHTMNARSAISQKRATDFKHSIKQCDVIFEHMLEYTDKKLKIRVNTVRENIKNIEYKAEHNLLGNGHSIIAEIEASIQSAQLVTGENIWSTKT